MVFNSLIFVLFFLIVATGYWGLANWTLRKSFLVLASFVFYASYRPIYVFILLVPILFDFWVALRLEAIKHAGARKAFLTASLALNLGFLAYFKYTNFALETVAAMAPLFGGSLQTGPLDIFLPIGISFHVFQSMAYVVDTYRRQIKPTRSLLDFMLFVSFFPQLVAGPIVRAHEFLPQLEKPRPVSGQYFGWAATLITIGIFEKVVLADGILGPISDKAFQWPMPQVGFVDAWLGTFAYAGQIFFDFNGYSLCAVGCAMALGFHLPWNFRFPYASLGFSDFWQRWHMSLSMWFRDYVYIPMGGNRHGIVATLRNLFLTMALAGLWHGAAWHFVIWGLLHGAYLVLERGAQLLGLWPTEASPWLVKIPAVLVTFLCVCIAWVFFRATSLEAALALLGHMFDPSAAGSHVLSYKDHVAVVVTMGPLLLIQGYLRNRNLQEIVASMRPAPLAGLLAVMVMMVWAVGGSARGFIYFQF